MNTYIQTHVEDFGNRAFELGKGIPELVELVMQEPDVFVPVYFGHGYLNRRKYTDGVQQDVPPISGEPMSECVIFVNKLEPLAIETISATYSSRATTRLSLLGDSITLGTTDERWDGDNTTKFMKYGGNALLLASRNTDTHLTLTGTGYRKTVHVADYELVPGINKFEVDPTKQPKDEITTIVGWDAVYAYIDLEEYIDGTRVDDYLHIADTLDAELCEKISAIFDIDFDPALSEAIEPLRKNFRTTKASVLSVFGLTIKPEDLI